MEHESHLNLLSLHSVSVLLKFLRQVVIEVFCSTSMLRSKKSSSLLVTCTDQTRVKSLLFAQPVLLPTVSQLRHRVSLVRMP